MKRTPLTLFAALLMAAAMLTSCEDKCKCGGNDEPQTAAPTPLDSVSFATYPKVDCSTSARAISVAAACTLLRIPYTWQPPGATTEWNIQPDHSALPEEHKDFFWKNLLFSQTHGAFMNLIDGVADIILTHRTLSADERAHADSLGVQLVEKSIALDAFVLVANKANPVKSLTAAQIRQIYKGEITSWKEVGGADAAMKVFTRPRNSGSEEIFRTLVMQGEEPADFPVSSIGPMILVFQEIKDNPEGICYTFDNYKSMVARVPDSEVPRLSVNGVPPTAANVRSGKYPFTAEVHVAIRADLDRSSMAYALFERLQSDAANMQGERKPFLPEPYTWKTYPEMNVGFWQKHQSTPYHEAKTMLAASHRQVMQLIERLTDDELFAKKHFPWTGTTSVGAYCISATSSHYDWAIKKLKMHRKTYKK